MEQSFIKTKVTGFAVVEVIDLEMQLNDTDKKAFEQNPEAVVQRLLEESGQEVNRMMLTRSFIEKHSKSKDTGMTPMLMKRDHYYHIVYPANERSGWICA